MTGMTAMSHAYLSKQKESSEQFSRRYEEYRARYLFPEHADAAQKPIPS